MNTKDYISSGILEAYALGSVTPQEKQEVECMSKIYPEIKIELDALQNATDSYAMVYAKRPSADLKAKIFAQMTFDEPTSIESTEAVNFDSTDYIEPKSALKTSDKVMPLWPKLAAAAAVMLGVLFFWSQTKNNQLSTELADSKSSSENKSAENNSVKNMLGMYQNTEFAKIKLNGLPLSPKSGVMVFWDVKTSEVKLVVESLPKPPKGKQYQLWTLVDGKPIDMGMIDHNFNGNVITMKSTNKNVQAFAITLEKDGGSSTPTMEEMYVLGNV